MKLVVTGGAGFIGSAVVRQAISKGWEVLNIDKLTYAANLDNLTNVSGHEKYSFLHADICDGATLSNAINDFEPDVIMHLAAESHVDRSIDSPGQFIQTNLVGTYTLLEIAKEYNKSKKLKFHHVSTDEVFGSLGEDGEFFEDSPYQPNSPYSATKAGSDMLVRAWGETFKMPVVISNCSNNYGPYQFPEKLVPVVINAAKQGNPIPIYGNGLNVRDWLHVSDHADALLLIAEQGVSGETYNVGGRAEKSNLELVNTICDLMDQKLIDSEYIPHNSLVKFVTDRPGHDARYAVNCSKIQRELGWQPKHSFEQGMAETIDWYLNNEDWLVKIQERGFSGERLGLSNSDTRS